jgi:hypothetical protein
MPMLIWFPMIVMAGICEAISDDLATWHRAFSVDVPDIDVSDREA